MVNELYDLFRNIADLTAALACDPVPDINHSVPGSGV